MGQRRRTGRDPLNAEDRALWSHVTRNVLPLARISSAAPEEKLDSPPAPPASRATRKTGAGLVRTDPAPTLRPAPLPSPPEPQLAPLNRSWARALRRGDLVIEARLDLHGLTEDRAYRALERFVAETRAAGLRTVLVVTGKGRGILKGRLPAWLTAGGLASAVLAYHPAHVRDGGGGAYYLVLRRLPGGGRGQG